MWLFKNSINFQNISIKDFKKAKNFALRTTFRSQLMPRGTISFFCDGSGDFRIVLPAPLYPVSGPKSWSWNTEGWNSVATVDKEAPFQWRCFSEAVSPASISIHEGHNKPLWLSKHMSMYQLTETLMEISYFLNEHMYVCM